MDKISEAIKSINIAIRRCWEKGFNIKEIDHPDFYGNIINNYGNFEIKEGVFRILVEKNIYPEIIEYSCDKCGDYTTIKDSTHMEGGGDPPYHPCDGKLVIDEERTANRRSLQWS